MDIEEPMEWLATVHVNVIKENKNVQNPAPMYVNTNEHKLTRFSPFIKF